MSTEQIDNEVEQASEGGNSNRPRFTLDKFPMERMRLGNAAKGFFENKTYKTTHLLTFVIPADGDETTLLDYELEEPPMKGNSILYYLAEDSEKPTLYMSQDIHPTFSQPDANGKVSRATTAKSRFVEDFWRRWHARCIELLKERAATKEGRNFLIRVMGMAVLENLLTCLGLPFAKRKYGDKHRLRGQFNEDASVRLKYTIWSQEVSKMKPETREKHDQAVKDGKKMLMIPGTDIVIYTGIYEMIKGVRESKDPLVDYEKLRRYISCLKPHPNASRDSGDLFSKLVIGAPCLVFNPSKDYKGTVSIEAKQIGILGFNVRVFNGAMNDAQYQAQQQEGEDAMAEAGFVQEVSVPTLELPSEGAIVNHNGGTDDSGFRNKRLKSGDGTSLQLGTGHMLLGRQGDGSDDMGCDPDVAQQAWLEQQAYEDF